MCRHGERTSGNAINSAINRAVEGIKLLPWYQVIAMVSKGFELQFVSRVGDF